MPWDDKKDGVRRKWGDETPGDRSSSGAEGSHEPQAQSEGAKLDEMIRRAEPLIEQVNNLHAQFLAGVERLPPNERRKQLEALMAQLSVMAKPNATYRFRVDTLHTRFVTFRDRWDKMIRDLEAGRIKRTAGPKR